MGRHAAIASRLLRHLLHPQTAGGLDPPVPPWTRLAAYLLRQACPALHPAQTLLAATMSTPAAVQQGVLDAPALVQYRRLPQGPLTHLAVALQAVGPLSPSAASPPSCLPAAITQPPTDPAGLPALLETLAWSPLPLPGGQPSPQLFPALGTTAVQPVTALLATASSLRRRQEHIAFIRLAQPPLPWQQALPPFLRALAVAWRLPCDNNLKEPLWRLAVHAIPGARIPQWSCPCSLHSPPLPGAANSRQHSFWAGPVAQAVRSQLEQSLPPGSLQCYHLWLLQPPSPALLPPVWTLVCLAAVAAMEWGRRFLWACRRGPHWPDPGPQGITALAQTFPQDLVDYHLMPVVLAARDQAVRSVANAAALRFWTSLQDFAAAFPRSPWPLPPDHPFLHAPGGTLLVRLPARQT
jgi:hypothetical protein